MWPAAAPAQRKRSICRFAVSDFATNEKRESLRPRIGPASQSGTRSAALRHAEEGNECCSRLQSLGHTEAAVCALAATTAMCMAAAVAGSNRRHRGRRGNRLTEMASLRLFPGARGMRAAVCLLCCVVVCRGRGGGGGEGDPPCSPCPACLVRLSVWGRETGGEDQIPCIFSRFGLQIARMRGFVGCWFVVCGSCWSILSEVESSGHAAILTPVCGVSTRQSPSQRPSSPCQKGSRQCHGFVQNGTGLGAGTHSLGFPVPSRDRHEPKPSGAVAGAASSPSLPFVWCHHARGCYTHCTP